MALWGLAIIGISLILYYASKHQPVFVFTSGLGVGLFVGAIWAYLVAVSVLSRFAP